jgi:acyl-coenzyme A synthetase/AMP-(fatty) acid ligase
VQLRRIADLPPEILGRYDLSGLRAVLTGSDPLPPELCGRLLEVFGDKVFNLYGSTEAGWATIATPEDLRAAPGTVGRAPDGVRVEVLDAGGTPVPRGRTGVVHVAGWRRGGWWRGGGPVSTGDPVTSTRPACCIWTAGWARWYPTLRAPSRPRPGSRPDPGT